MSNMVFKEEGHEVVVSLNAQQDEFLKAFWSVRDTWMAADVGIKSVEVIVNASRSKETKVYVAFLWESNESFHKALESSWWAQNVMHALRRSLGGMQLTLLSPSSQIPSDKGWAIVQAPTFR